MKLVTYAQAAAHLRLDTDAEIVWVNDAIEDVSDAVARWLKDSWRLYVPSGFEDSQGNPIPAEDSQGDLLVRPVVRRAVLVELAQQHRYRDGTGAATVPAHEGHGYVLGMGATAILAGLRRSTVA